MDIEATAKRIREAIFDRAESEGRVMHASSVEDEIAKVLRERMPKQGIYGYGLALGDAAITGIGMVRVTAISDGEWR